MVSQAKTKNSLLCAYECNSEALVWKIDLPRHDGYLDGRLILRYPKSPILASTFLKIANVLAIYPFCAIGCDHKRSCGPCSAKRRYCDKAGLDSYS